MERNRRLTDDIYISRLGVGTWAMGGSGAYGDVTAEKAIDALEYYFSEGGNFIDSAEGYSNAELVIGQFLKNSKLQHEAVIATKTQAGQDWESLPEIETRLDKSLKRLGREYVDLYYFHTPPEEDDLIEAALYEMQKLKQKGKIRAVGGSIRGVNVTNDTVELCKKYIDSKKMDAIQLVYNILRQQTNEVFDYAMANKVALIGRTSLETGFLSGKYKKGHRFAENDHRKRWNTTFDMIADYVDMVEQKFIGKADDSMTSLALRFAMQPEAISDTIVGAKNREQMEESIAIYKKGPLDDIVVSELEEMFRGKTDLFNVPKGYEDKF